MRRLALVILLAAVSCSSGPRLAPLAPDAVVVAFGDSLTAGAGAAAGSTYPDILAEKIGRTVINAGVPGETAEEGLVRLPAVLAEYEPALVILCEGGNDMLRKRDPAAIAEDLRAMIGLIRDAGADVLLVGVPNPALLLKTAPYYRELAESEGVPCECEIVADVLSRPGLKSDQIHPNAQGYAKMADAIADAIADAAR
jgi:acyl-CoA thioesterase-1